MLQVNRHSLDLNKAYLQVTYVEPFLEKWEKRRRPTLFERSQRLNRFVYATPFTKEGRAHGDLQEQYKRRTILTTEQRLTSFPLRRSQFPLCEVANPSGESRADSAYSHRSRY